MNLFRFGCFENTERPYFSRISSLSCETFLETEPISLMDTSDDPLNDFFYGLSKLLWVLNSKIFKLLL